MTSPPPLTLLLDEHYPPWLAQQLTADGVDSLSILGDWRWLSGASDIAVLKAAVADGRMVVTEDISTFPGAAAAVPNHFGIIYCHPRRFPRTRPGLARLKAALVHLASNPPAELGKSPTTWWLTEFTPVQG